jgi:excinuclease ABC subunit B
VGRAARHVNGRAILYGDVMTDSMREALGETNRRRAKQDEYNREHGITPESIVRPVDMALAAIVEADYVTVPLDDAEPTTPDQLQALITNLEAQMKEAARKFEFEKAAVLRDRVKALREKEVGVAPASNP